ncbi:MAG: hypothetical protein PHY92_08120 [Alphaproteobacteria bacterium]|nr:hypothetical protein [Alphaproteobacteria bacterium]
MVERLDRRIGYLEQYLITQNYVMPAQAGISTASYGFNRAPRMPKKKGLIRPFFFGVPYGI